MSPYLHFLSFRFLLFFFSRVNSCGAFCMHKSKMKTHTQHEMEMKKKKNKRMGSAFAGAGAGAVAGEQKEC